MHPVQSARFTGKRNTRTARVCVVLLVSAAFAPLAAASSSTRLFDRVDGTRVTVHGWSSDGRYLAYSRQKTRMKRQGGKAVPRVVTTHVHRRLKSGRFDGRGPKIRGDASKYAVKRGYVREAPIGYQLDSRLFRFDAPEGSYMVDIRVDDQLGWELSLDGKRLEKKLFNDLYVAAQVQVYPSPTRTSVLVVMHLDTGWRVDAAVYLVPLPPEVTSHWQTLTHPTPTTLETRGASDDKASLPTDTKPEFR